jgi:hypothetical protein
VTTAGWQHRAGIHGLPLPMSCQHHTELFLPGTQAYLAMTVTFEMELPAPAAGGGYVGSFAVFAHGGCFGDEGHCDVRGPVSSFGRCPPDLPRLEGANRDVTGRAPARSDRPRPGPAARSRRAGGLRRWLIHTYAGSDR